MSFLRWGVLSTAKIGRTLVIPAMQDAQRCEVVAIASRDATVARRVADDLSIERAYGSYDALLADADIDAVYIPLPNHMHADWVIAAARQGKHVLCEKPIALSVAEATTMVTACAEAGVILREAFMYRYQPTWQAVLHLIGEGDIGDITGVDSFFSYFNDDPSNIRNVLEYGGGALMDIGCYPIHLSRLLMGGEPTQITASTRRDPTTGVDTYVAAILEFGDRIATFACSTRVEPDQRVDIYGTTGRVSIEIPFNPPADQPTRFTLTRDGGSKSQIFEFEASNHYSLQAEAMAAAILDGDSLQDSGADVLGNIAVIERVFAAAG